ncbi:hypothetical protein C8J57DRAFT_1495392 [Mycena rebaudengoi]|nr:hypothetical protein C8J57DRAFT_1495392 [Mycena rebaudengoi]
MLDILSALSSLPFLSSKSLVSFLEGPIVAAQISVLVVVSGFNFKSVVLPYNTATRTTAAVLSPTRCALSNGSLASPFSLFLGYFIIILVSIVCTLRAKGFTTKCTSGSPPQNRPSRSRNSAEDPPVDTDGDGQPPVSPESATNSLNAPRRTSWMLFLLILLALVLALLLGYHYAKGYQVLPLSIFLGGLQLTESTISALVHYAFAIQTYIVTTGKHYLIVLLLAVVAYSVATVLTRTLLRLCPLVEIRVSSWLHHYGNDLGLLSSILGVVLCLVDLFKLLAYGEGITNVGWHYLDVVEFRIGFVLHTTSSWAFHSPLADYWNLLSLADRLIILGPAVVQALIASVWSMTLVTSCTAPKITRSVLSFVRFVLTQPIIVFIAFPASQLVTFCIMLYLEFKLRPGQSPWLALRVNCHDFIHAARDSWRLGKRCVWIFNNVLQRSFTRIVKLLLGLWKIKCCFHGDFCVHKLLIVLPAVTYFSYFHFVNPGRHQVRTVFQEVAQALASSPPSPPPSLMIPFISSFPSAPFNSVENQLRFKDIDRDDQ